jgi:hypothetical protein
MSYKNDIIKKVRNSDLWPDYKSPDFLVTLNELADELLKKKSIEGALAAVLIYHQLLEEQLRLLLRSAQFYIQLSVFPAEIIFPDKKRQMFGQVIDELKQTISFSQKDKILELATSLNGHRIELVHKLASRQKTDNIVSQAIEVKKTFNQLFKMIDFASDEFRVAFKDFKKDVFVDYP